MKKLCILLCFFWLHQSIAQNKQVLYDFAELPQTLLLNPASETNYKFHIGFPLLSGISFDASSTGFVLTDIFAEDGIHINDKISKALQHLTSKDFLTLNTQIEVLNAGFRLNDSLYLSFGFYEELELIGYYPKDLVTLITEGNNAYLNKNFMVSQINFNAEFLGVLHIGLAKQVNENLRLGLRFKMYSSALHIETNNNTGTFTTAEGTNNLFTHYFNNINLASRTAGLIDTGTEEYIDDFGKYFGNTFLGSNMGIGFDFGVFRKISPQLEFSASILDLGFVYHKSNIKNTKVEGNFSFEGVDLLFNTNNSNYWDALNRRFRRDLPTTENQNSYFSWRPTKINAALKYRFGEKKSRRCYDYTYKDFFTDAVGLQLYSVLRPTGSQLALTGFYEKALTKKIFTKFTYTVDDFSLANIGAGISAQLGKFNMFTMVDNILSYNNLSSSNHLSLQVGFNLIFN
ncbi:DUF5723 family protein [Polaribacter sp.]|uniref:DUF5723 family protein n=1 Tax=Polaribacter sp. TaxID=1920175 RepID=UPI003F6B9024